MPFLKLSAKNLFVQASITDIGNYTISIALKDDNPVPKTTIYEFDISITEDSGNIRNSLFPEFY